MRRISNALIVGAKGLVVPKQQQPQRNNPTTTTTSLIRTVLQGALQQAGLALSDVDGLIAVPSLASPHLMEAHFQATQLGLFDAANNHNHRKGVLCRTLDTGGAGPVSALRQAQSMIQQEDDNLHCVAVVAADTVGSMTSSTFLKRVEDTMTHTGGDNGGTITTSTNTPTVPIIPQGYDRYTQYHMDHHGLTRDQLRMVVCLQSFHASQHSESLFYHQQRQQRHEQHVHSGDTATTATTSATTLHDLQQAPSVTPHISLLECAHRADGAGCILVASPDFWEAHQQRRRERENEETILGPAAVRILGTGEASGPLHPPHDIRSVGAADVAMAQAYRQAGMTVEDMDFFGLYDCFPICLIRALEAAGISSNGGKYIQEQYSKFVQALEQGTQEDLLQDPTFFPINTHGGLLCYGAPWEVRTTT